ncbi:MAG: hypothetical protein ABIO88_00850 [Burkholderiaceae bacterium]
MATNKKLGNDATPSVDGTIFQICVALERAFMLEEGQKLWIEKFGDVTTSDHAQIETKHYSDSLTDSHLNFWNTLKNWVLPSFENSSYRYLTLLTTQQIGSQSKLLYWNDATVHERLEILKKILADSENRYEVNQKSKPENATISPPQSLALQRSVLNPAHSTKLAEIVGKIWIESASPKLPELRKKIFAIYGKAILHGKSDEFLDDLMGFLISPSTTKDGWEVSFDAFTEKVALVSARYHRDTRIFPLKNIPLTTDQIDIQSEKTFVKKLHEIDYQVVISEAIQNYLFASITVLEELQSYCVPPEHYQTYESNLKQIHKAKHRSASRQITGDAKVASQNFYDNLTSESPQLFPRFDQTPIEFRNGVFQMLADSDTEDFQWRLW